MVLLPVKAKNEQELGQCGGPCGFAERYGVEALRYYLLREIPTADDGDFSMERFKVCTKMNSKYGWGIWCAVIVMTQKYTKARFLQEMEQQRAHCKGVGAVSCTDARFQHKGALLRP